MPDLTLLGGDFKCWLVLLLSRPLDGLDGALNAGGDRPSAPPPAIPPKLALHLR